MKAQCTPSPYRRITRWEHEDVLDTMQKRLNRTPRPREYAARPSSIRWHDQGLDGATHFLTKTIPRVSTEMSLHVLAYNMKRAMQVVGIAPLVAAIRA